MPLTVRGMLRIFPTPALSTGTGTGAGAGAGVVVDQSFMCNVSRSIASSFRQRSIEVQNDSCAEAMNANSTTNRGCYPLLSLAM